MPGSRLVYPDSVKKDKRAIELSPRTTEITRPRFDESFDISTVMDGDSKDFAGELQTREQLRIRNRTDSLRKSVESIAARGDKDKTKFYRTLGLGTSLDDVAIKDKVLSSRENSEHNYEQGLPSPSQKEALSSRENSDQLSPSHKELILSSRENSSPSHKERVEHALMQPPVVNFRCRVFAEESDYETGDSMRSLSFAYNDKPGSDGTISTKDSDYTFSYNHNLDSEFDSFSSNHNNLDSSAAFAETTQDCQTKPTGEHRKRISGSFSTVKEEEFGSFFIPPPKGPPPPMPGSRLVYPDSVKKDKRAIELSPRTTEITRPRFDESFDISTVMDGDSKDFAGELQTREQLRIRNRTDSLRKSVESIAARGDKDKTKFYRTLGLGTSLDDVAIKDKVLSSRENSEHNYEQGLPSPSQKEALSSRENSDQLSPFHKEQDALIQPPVVNFRCRVFAEESDDESGTSMRSLSFAGDDKSDGTISTKDSDYSFSSYHNPDSFSDSFSFNDSSAAFAETTILSPSNHTNPDSSTAFAETTIMSPSFVGYAGPRFTDTDGIEELTVCYSTKNSKVVCDI